MNQRKLNGNLPGTHRTENPPGAKALIKPSTYHQFSIWKDPLGTHWTKFLRLNQQTSVCSWLWFRPVSGLVVTALLVGFVGSQTKVLKLQRDRWYIGRGECTCMQGYFAHCSNGDTDAPNSPPMEPHLLSQTEALWSRPLWGSLGP